MQSVPSGHLPSADRTQAGGPLARPTVAAALAIHFGLALGAILLSRQPGSLAALWFANAVGAGLLLAAPARRWPALVATIGASVLAANLVAGHDASVSASFVPGNAFESFLCAWMLRRSGIGGPAPRGVLTLIRRWLAGVFVPTAVGATVGAAVLAAHGFAGFAAAWPLWFLGSAIGMTATLPLAVSLALRGPLPVLRELSRPRVALSVLVGTAAVTALSLLAPFPFVFVALVLVAVALVGGIAANAVATLSACLSVGGTIALGWLRPQDAAHAANPIALYAPLLATLLPATMLASAVDAHRRATRAIAESEARFRTLYFETPALLVSTDLDGRIVSASRRWLEHLGYRDDEVLGRPGWELMTPDSARHARDVLMPTLRREGSVTDQRLVVVARDGGQRHMKASAIVRHDPDGVPTWLLLSMVDVTEQRRLGEALADERELTEVTLRSIADAVVTTDAVGRVRYLNPAAERLLACTRIEAVGRPFAEVVRLFGGRGVPLDPLGPCLADGRAVSPADDVELRPQVGVSRQVRLTTSPLRDDGGTSTRGAVTVLRDVTAAQAMAQRMAHVARHDSLTGLPNRMLMQDRIERACRTRDRGGDGFAVAFLDLDRFKQVNDALGHAVGDELLRGVALRLQAALHDWEAIGRIGGDEFVMLLPGVADGGAAAEAARRLQGALREPVDVDTHRIAATASIGLVLCPAHGTDAGTLMRHADAAMYAAKRDGRGRSRVYDDSIGASTETRVALEAAIRDGLARGEFEPFYQPLVDASGTMVGVEALARWRPAPGGGLAARAVHGLLPPAEFIPVAEDSGLIVPMGDAILARACADFAGWRRRGARLATLSVNVSPVQLEHDDFAASVARTLQATGLPADALELEVTETAMLAASDATQASLDALARLGVRLAIDDFGVGYSNLAMLHRLHASTLKIDRSFVADAPDRAESRAIVAAVVDIGRSLRLNVLAEGVETAEQATLMAAMGCDRMQGWHFGRPVPADAIEARLLPRGETEEA